MGEMTKEGLLALLGIKANKNLPVNRNIKAFQRVEAEQSRVSILQSMGLDPEDPNADAEYAKRIDREWPKSVHRQGQLIAENKNQELAAKKQGYRVTPQLDDKGKPYTPKEFPKEMDRPAEMRVNNAKELDKAKKAGWLEAPYIAEEAELQTA